MESARNQDTFCDPDGSSYILNSQIDLAHTAAQKSDTFNHYIYYHINAKCGDTEGTVDSTNQGASSIAIVYTLEGGAIYCGDNQ